MRFSVFAFVVAAVFCGQAAAINKCMGPDGRVSFQDAPCSSGKGEAIDVRPASGKAAPAAPGGEAQRLEGIIADSQRSRRSRDLRERLLPAAETAVTQHRTACAEKQQDLAGQQYAYRQNLYGKTHAAQIASEMAAAASMCETRARELRETVDALAKECAALACRL
jgi:hypothetical protein